MRDFDRVAQDIGQTIIQAIRSGTREKDLDLRLWLSDDVPPEISQALSEDLTVKIGMSSNGHAVGLLEG